MANSVLNRSPVDASKTHAPATIGGINVNIHAPASAEAEARPPNALFGLSRASCIALVLTLAIGLVVGGMFVKMVSQIGKPAAPEVVETPLPPVSVGDASAQPGLPASVGTPPAAPEAPVQAVYPPVGDPEAGAGVQQAAATPPEWEYASQLLEPALPPDCRGMDESQVDFRGTKYTHSLREGPYGRDKCGFFWKFADLPSPHSQFKPTRLTCTFALDDASDPNSAAEFELRLNNGTPKTYHVTPSSPAHVSESLRDTYRVDVTATESGEGSGRVIVVEPKLYFR